MFRQNILLCSIVLTLSCAGAPAHQDTILTLKDNKLVGLPGSYQPAELDLKDYRLRIKDHRMDFSPFIKSLFRPQPYDLEVTASWYHDRSILPPYMAMKISPRERDFSYQILFNLDTLDVIQVVVVILESDSVTRDFTVELSEIQKRGIKESISNVKKNRICGN